MDGLRRIFTPQVRTFIYAISGIFHAFAIVYFQITEEIWQIWISMVIGLFDAIMALLNTPTTNKNITETPPPTT